MALISEKIRAIFVSKKISQQFHSDLTPISTHFNNFISTRGHGP